MALTIVLGLTILSVANYGSTYEFSGQLKPTIKPFSALTNQHYQGDQFKSQFGYNSVPPKPFGAPFEHFKQSYQPYQPYRANYQPFGPYPGYPGPVVYPGHGGYQGPEAYRFNEPNHKPFGFQPFPAPVQPEFNQYNKFGPSKKFNKNFPGLADFNQAGKYYQEHQFGAYHGPEFSSAIIPAEHNIKQSRPKDTLLGKPVEFGLPKQTSFGFPSPPSFGYPVPNFPPVKPFISAVPAVKSVPAKLVPVNAVKIEQKFGGAEVTTAVIPSSSARDDSATVEQQSVDVTSEPSAVTPAADAQATSPAQADVTSSVSSDAQAPTAAEVVTNNEVPTEQDNQSPNSAVPIENGALPAEVPINNEAPASAIPIDGESPSAEDASRAQAQEQSATGAGPIEGASPSAEDASRAQAQEQSATGAGPIEGASPSAEDASRAQAQEQSATDAGSIDGTSPSAEDASGAQTQEQSATGAGSIDGTSPSAEDASGAQAQEQNSALSSSSSSNEPSNVGSEQTASIPQDDVVQEPSPIVVAEEVKDTSSAGAAQVSNEPSESSAAVSGPAKSEVAAAENKPATGPAAVNLPGLPVELQNTQFGPVPISDTSSLGQFGSSGFPYFGQSAGPQQPSYYPYFDATGFSEEELKAFTANFASQVPQSGQVFGNSPYPAANIPQGASFSNPAENIPQSASVSNPSAEIATLIESTNNAKNQDKAASDEKQTQKIVPGSPLPSPLPSSLPNSPKTQPKFNSVQIVQNDPFNGQLPLLYDPSNSASPLDTYKFYNHPSVSKWSSQASLASYSPESAFNNFGSQFHQGYLVEGSPTLTPLAKSVVQSGPTPLSISSPDHPLHSQVFKYSQSFVPYPGLVAGNNNAAAFQSFGVPSSTAAPFAASSTTATADAAAAADVSVQSTSAPEVTVDSSSSEAPAGESA